MAHDLSDSMASGAPDGHDRSADSRSPVRRAVHGFNVYGAHDGIGSGADAKEGSVKKYRCDGCWSEDANAYGWVFFNFKHLKPSWLCVDCIPVWGAHFTLCQARGL